MSSTTERVYKCHFDGGFSTSYTAELGVRGMLHVMCVCIVQKQVNGDLEISGRYDCTSHAV